MSLRIRRGTDLQRQSITFDPGEVVYTTDTKKLFIGDGATAGGVNVLATMAGSSVVYNSTTNALDFNPSGLTTTNIAEGNNLYYTSNRAKDAAAQIFTAAGAPTASGTITSLTSPSTLTLNSTIGLVQGERIVISGGGLGGGLTAGTYYVCAVTDGTRITISTTQALALAGTAITSFTTATISGAWTAGGTDTGITFVYDNINRVMSVTSNGLGITSVSQDTSPQLGGNLNLNSRNITGTGNISITAGNISASGTITASTGLGADLSLNSRSITGTGNISIAGRLAITNSAQEVSQFVGLNSTGSSVTTPQINMYTSRGTVTSPTASQPGDYLTSLSFGGYKSGAYFQAVNFISILDSAANMSNASPAGGLGIAINDNAGGNSIFRFSYQGVLTAPVFQAASYTTTNMNAIPNPAAGMIVFNSTVNHFYGYNGTAWVAFTGP
jgi:hypothetical protein